MGELVSKCSLSAIKGSYRVWPQDETCIDKGETLADGSYPGDWGLHEQEVDP